LNKKSLAALALAACAAAASAQSRHERIAIEVEVVDDKVVVPEEVAHTTEDEDRLVWRLISPGYMFAADGIVFQRKGRHSCGPGNDGRAFRCAKLGHEKGASFKYAVKVIDVRQPKASAVLPVLDPLIQND
jgi:hypothetical protein